jgi:pimeloyl-ACP methyl ester carboxylesterase
MTNTWPLIHHNLDDFSEPWADAPAPVVLLHPGLAGNGRLYRQWVPVLADRYRVLRVDARGQGMSPLPDGYAWSIDRFVADVVDVLDHHGIERVHWIGASGGGIIGQHAAASAPERFASLTLLATTPRFRSPTPNVDDWLAPLDRGDAAGFFRQDIERRFGLEQPERTDWIITEILRTPVATIASLYRWVVTVDLIGELPQITCPTLIVTGEHDTLTDLSDAGLMQREIPNARLHVIEGHPHNVGYTHPRLVAGIVRTFLDEVTDEGMTDGE